MELRQRRLRTLALASALMAMGSCLFAASHAHATNWVVEGTKLKGGESREVAISQEGTMTLKSTILGAALQVTLDPAVTCSGTGSCTITQNGMTSTATGTYTLSVPVTTTDKPSGCTAALTWSTVAFSVISLIPHPVARIVGGAGLVLGTLILSHCAFEGTYQLKTSKGLYADMEPLKTFLVSQPFRFSPEINAAAGGELTLGGSAAELTGELSFALAGSGAGKKWGVE
jgi:hypothetical protein